MMKQNQRTKKPGMPRKNRRIQPSKNRTAVCRKWLAMMFQYVFSFLLALGVLGTRAGKKIRCETENLEIRQKGISFLRLVLRVAHQQVWPVMQVGMRGIWMFVRKLFQKEQRARVVAWVRIAAVVVQRVRIGKVIRYLRAIKMRDVNVTRLVRFLNPRVVRLEEPGRYLAHTMTISIFFAGVAICALGVAATSSGQFGKSAPSEAIEPGSEPANWLDAADNNLPSDDIAMAENMSTEGESPISITRVPTNLRASTGEKQRRTARTADFYNPFYVFTQASAQRVNAYPLANPPGIVVDIIGIEEPTESALQMVGDDKRILRVKRRVTKGGVRYIIRLRDSVQRIESHTEGNVITINPLS